MIKCGYILVAAEVASLHFILENKYMLVIHIFNINSMHCCNLNGHLYTIKMIDSPACSCGFVNKNEFHFLLVCPLYNRPRVTLQNAMGHIIPFTLRTLLYGDDNLDLAENKRIITETLRFINDSKRFP